MRKQRVLRGSSSHHLLLPCPVPPSLLPPAFRGYSLQTSLPSVVLEQLGTAVIGIVPPLHGQNPWAHLSSDGIIQKNIWPRTWRQSELWGQFFCDRIWERRFYHLNLNGTLAWAQAGLDLRVVNWKLKKHLQQLCFIDREIKLQSGEVTCSRSHSKSKADL